MVPALLGGGPLFSTHKPTSGLHTPDRHSFFRYLKRVYDTGFRQGTLTAELEERLAYSHGTKHCVTFCNGLWAIITCMYSLAVPGKDEVIMPSFTYRRMGDAAEWAWLTPHYCDIDKKLVACPVTIEPCINKNTGLILITQPMINCVPYGSLQAIARYYNIPIMFDSVEVGWGGFHDGRLVGSFGNAECFSLHASKLINGFEGGYVTTNDSALAKTLTKRRQERNQLVMNETHAAMALANLDELDQYMKHNEENYKEYHFLLQTTLGLRVWEQRYFARCGYKNVVLEVEEDFPLTRDELLQVLNLENILARPYYPKPLHLRQTHYQTIYGSLPTTEWAKDRFILLPTGDFVSRRDVTDIGYFLRGIKDYADDIKTVLGRG